MGFGRGALLWLLGIPLPIIILLAEVPCAELTHLTPGAEVVGGELTLFLMDDFRQILAQQDERPPHGDDVDGHEQLVQDQHTGVQGTVRVGIHGIPSGVMPSGHRPAAASRFNGRTTPGGGS